MQAGDRLWNGVIATQELARAYNRIEARMVSFETAGRPIPQQLFNGRFNLIAGAR